MPGVVGFDDKLALLEVGARVSRQLARHPLQDATNGLALGGATRAKRGRLVGFLRRTFRE